MRQTDVTQGLAVGESHVRKKEGEDHNPVTGIGVISENAMKNIAAMAITIMTITRIARITASAALPVVIS